MAKDSFVISCDKCGGVIEVPGTRNREYSPTCLKFLKIVTYGHIVVTLLFAFYVCFSFTKWSARLGSIDDLFIGSLFVVILASSMYTILHIWIYIWIDSLRGKWGVISGSPYDNEEDNQRRLNVKAPIWKAWLFIVADLAIFFLPNYNECELLREKAVALRAHPEQHYGCKQFDYNKAACSEWKGRSVHK